MRLELIAFTVLLLVHSTAIAAVPAPVNLYWTDTTGTITQSELDGSSVTHTLNLSGQGLGLSIDPLEKKMYWTQSDDRIVRRANLDGSEVENVIDLGGFGGSIALDPIDRKIYWRQITIPDTETIIARADFDGGNVETVVTLNAGGGGSLAIDPLGKKAYWTTQQFGSNGFTNVRRVNLDGSDIEVIATGRRYSDIEVDPIHQKVYWTTVDTGDRRIQRVDLDGSNLEDILPDTLDFSAFTDYVHLPRSITLDPIAGRIYWINDQFRDDRIMSARLDGADISQLLRSPSNGLNVLATNRFVVPEPTALVLISLGCCIMYSRRSHFTNLNSV